MKKLLFSIGLFGITAAFAAHDASDAKIQALQAEASALDDALLEATADFDAIQKDLLRQMAARKANMKGSEDLDDRLLDAAARFDDRQKDLQRRSAAKKAEARKLAGF